MKRGVKKKQKVVKGTPAAVVLSILIHAGLFLLAGLFVVFTVLPKEPVEFKAAPQVNVPKMPLKKLKVRTKKPSKPKATAKITAVVDKIDLQTIAFPDLPSSGMGTGIGGVGGGIGGFGDLPGIEDSSIFGSDVSKGNDFEGAVYSLLHNNRGGAASMDQNEFRDVLQKYVSSGWNNTVLSRYYRAPGRRYTTHFMVPPIPTAMAPGVFGVPELEDYYLFIKYEGPLVHSKDIKFRFWGVGDAYIFVNVDGKEVLMSAWAFHHPWFNWWTGGDAKDRNYILGNQRMVVGDWIELKAGEPLDMKVLFGEWVGGSVTGMLLVEVEGVEYPISRSGGPLLPAFKTEELTWDTITEISRFLAEDECTLTNGPVFNDFHSAATSPRPVADRAPAPQEKSVEKTEDESALRVWTMADGRTAEAEFVVVMGRNAVLKNYKGRQIKVPLENLSEADRTYIRFTHTPTLDINFAKTTEQRRFGPTYSAAAPPVRGNFYTFSTRIKQTSLRPYGFGLTAEYFVIGDEIGGHNHILLDYQKTDFSLTEENDYTFEFGGNPVELLDYTINSERRGQRYGGFLVVVKDFRGEVIAYETPSKDLYRNLDNLREIQVGWYFDDECNRCLPKPPKPWFNVSEN